MRGTIAKINQKRGMVAVKTERLDFSIFELLGSDSVEIGDQVEWRDDASLGDTALENKTRGSRFQVYFQNHQVGPAILDKQLLF